MYSIDTLSLHSFSNAVRSYLDLSTTMPKQGALIGRKTRGARRFKRWYGKNRAMKIAKVQTQRAGLCYCPNRYVRFSNPHCFTQPSIPAARSEAGVRKR